MSSVKVDAAADRAVPRKDGNFLQTVWGCVALTVSGQRPNGSSHAERAVMSRNDQ